ncbi:TIGR04282 family arsenosugar biosynthesis glycosyltransferase [uncultured Eudoraea sp.]|uniref:TIGR04282 family arsenosugar biosynthesis glycosyltransferase n=1 Tax=uncultured Eudoraea sp. TaxID=1035614 RepID=UPI00262A5B6B|nr:TIGR04282 family arsenosugar biosynthesis glycosyltransferase [uncultured Eudoraea sp.]
MTLEENKDRLLLIFTRNPKLGKCKTRLAATIGDQAALDIYMILLRHTAKITKGLNCSKEVYYSEEVSENDLWDKGNYTKQLQEGNDLGERMYNAFKSGFKKGYKKIIIIGSDIYDLNSETIDEAFAEMENADFVIGPAADGGYYLLGMKALNNDIFLNKNWGTETVLEDTLNDLNHKKVKLLQIKNDIDVYEDLKEFDIFQSFVKI